MDGAFITTSKKLEDTGTRYQHTSELLDYVNAGIEVCENTLARYSNDKDKDRLKSLRTTARVIETYMERLANYDGKKFDLNKVLDENSPSKETLYEIRVQRIAKAEARAKTKEEEEEEANNREDEGDLSTA